MEPFWKPPSAKLSYVIILASPFAVFNNRLAGRIGTDDPPGIQAFNLLPFAMPPQYSSLQINSSTEIFISSSYTPGFLILPQAEINFVPVDFPIPIFAYSSPPILIMGTTAASVSTLFTTVGQSHKPFTAGNGGLILGLTSFSSSIFSNAVSSAH